MMSLASLASNPSAAAGAATPGTAAAGAAPRWSEERVAEVVDALGRRQRELPAWVLAESDDGDVVADAARDPSGVGERALLAERLTALVALPAPRAVVSIGEVGTAAAGPLLEALAERGTLEAIVVVELAAARARRAVGCVVARLASPTVVGVVGEPTLDLAVPAAVPQPRLYLGLRNILGRFGTVGAVRLLRAVRARMGLHDRLVLGLDLRRGEAAVERAYDEGMSVVAARHRGALALLNRALGTDFDVERFACRVVYDDDARRVETHLVAPRRLRVACGRHPAFTLRPGESIRTAVDGRYDRGQVAAMLDGVGLRLDAWHADDAAECAIAVAATAAAVDR